MYNIFYSENSELRMGVIGPLCDMLTAQAPKVVTVVLECLENILKVGKLYQDRYHGVNPYAFAVEEVNGKYSHIRSWSMNV